jgi:hypothetical protein
MVFQVEETEILPNDYGHRHAQRRGEISFRHLTPPFWMAQYRKQGVRKSIHISSLVKADGQPLGGSHVTKFRQVGRHDRQAIFASQVSDAAGSRSRRIGKDEESGAAEELCHLRFRDVTCELDTGMAG